MRLPLFCKAIHLVLVGLTAGRLAGWLAGWLAGRRNPGRFRIFKSVVIDRNSRPFTSFNKGTALLYYSSTNAFELLKPVF